jgi:D-tagatose-1,6-bisphosphate aldolase subunit GatZ/KbaZ
MRLFEQTYQQVGLDFSNLIAFVVQPGVEFSNDTVHSYDRARAANLMRAKRAYPGLVFEGHSTDYQTRRSLREMVEDGVAILKVGPALTFALREGLVALENIARELSPETAPSFRETLVAAMHAHPNYWSEHYSGDEAHIDYQLIYGLSDRCRYYLSEPCVRARTEELVRWFDNVDIPYALLRQYMPLQAARVWEGRLKKEANCLIYDKVDEILDDYLLATSPIEGTGSK